MNDFFAVIIAIDFAYCNDIFCLMRGVDRFEEYRKENKDLGKKK